MIVAGYLLVLWIGGASYPVAIVQQPYPTKDLCVQAQAEWDSIMAARRSLCIPAPPVKVEQR